MLPYYRPEINFPAKQFSNAMICALRNNVSIARASGYIYGTSSIFEPLSEGIGYVRRWRRVDGTRGRARQG